jgi:hypothetical protein
MTAIARSSVAALAALVSTSTPSFAQDTSGWSATGALLVGAADVDRDGSVTPQEWMAFVAGLRVGADERVDRFDLAAQLFTPFFDANNDRVIETTELDAVFARWDKDGSGAVDDADAAIDATLFDGENAFVEQLVLRLADAGVAEATDAPHDGRVTASEWRRFVAAQPGANGRLLPVAVYTWTKAALELPPPTDRDAFTPDVYLLTVFAELDLDKDGGIGVADLMSLHGRMDADGDGTIAAQELAPPPLVAQSDSGAANQTAELGIRDLYPPADEAQRALPPLAPFQRSLDDALVLVERTQKPLLVCVNMDGETASEALAWYLYREPAFADLMRGFVCVLASPDDRNALDFDDRGRRLADQRFGHVLDREAIAAEPELFERYFRGTRAAPRHVGVSASGEILFDVFLVDDLQLVADALAAHAVRPGERPRPAQEMSIAELLASPEAEHRDDLERRFELVGPEQRVALVAAALEPTRRVAHPQLVRLGLCDPDPSVRAAAVLAAASRPGAVEHELLVLAARVAEPGSVHEKELIDALARLVDATPSDEVRARAQRLHDVLAAQRGPTRVVDADLWRLGLALAPAPSPAAPLDYDSAIAALKLAEQGLAARPDDPTWMLAFADAALACGRAALASGQNPLFHFQDAANFAARAGERGAATLAQARWLLSDFAGADAAAQSALPLLASQASSAVAFEVLRVFTKVRGLALEAERAGGTPVEPTRIADFLAAHELLAAHPLATRDEVLFAIGTLGTYEAWRAQEAVVEGALTRFVHDSDVHAWLRAVLLRPGGGAAALRERYAALVGNRGDDALVAWYAGLAEIVAAEHLVKSRRPEEALVAYEACRDTFEDAVRLEAGYAASAGWYSALAAAGAARIHAGAGRLAEAVAALETAFDLAFAHDAGVLAAADGLGFTPRTVLADVAARVATAGEPDLVARAQALLDRE